MTLIEIHNLATDAKTFKFELKELGQYDFLEDLMFPNCIDC